MLPRMGAGAWKGFFRGAEYRDNMVHAFVMTKTAAGKSESLLEEVVELPHVTEAHIVAGDYDVVVELDTEEVYDILKTVSADIQAVDGVVDTKTYISMG